MELVEACAGLEFRTAPDLAPQLRKVVEVPRRLPRAAMETLAIVAYHQPVTRPEIEECGGRACPSDLGRAAGGGADRAEGAQGIAGPADALGHRARLPRAVRAARHARVAATGGLARGAAIGRAGARAGGAGGEEVAGQGGCPRCFRYVRFLLASRPENLAGHVRFRLVGNSVDRRRRVNRDRTEGYAGRDQDGHQRDQEGPPHGRGIPDARRRDDARGQYRRGPQAGQRDPQLRPQGRDRARGRSRRVAAHHLRPQPARTRSAEGRRRRVSKLKTGELRPLATIGAPSAAEGAPEPPAVVEAPADEAAAEDDAPAFIPPAFALPPEPPPAFVPPKVTKQAACARASDRPFRSPRRDTGPTWLNPKQTTRSTTSRCRCSSIWSSCARRLMWSIAAFLIAFVVCYHFSGAGSIRFSPGRWPTSCSTRPAGIGG